MPKSFVTDQSGLVSFSIKSNGKAISDPIEVYSIKINEQINTSTAEISILAGNPENGFSNVSDSDTFSPGAKIDIELGYDSKNTRVFTGTVTKQVIEADNSTVSYFKIVCINENTPGNNKIEYNAAASPVLELEYGENILNIELALNSKYQSSILTKYTGFIVFPGTDLAKANSLISLKGISKRFDGNVYVSGVEHNVSNGNWLTKAIIGISHETLDKSN